MGSMKQQSGFTTMEAILALVIATVITFATYGIYRAGHRAKTPISAAAPQNKSTGTTAQESCTAPSDWKAYSGTHGYFYYPASYELTHTGVGEESAIALLNKVNTTPKVVFLVGSTKWSDIAGIGMDADAVKSAYQEGGVKQVAQLSHDLNVGTKKPSKAVGPLVPFSLCGNTAWGFTVSGDFTEGFAADRGGELLDEETSMIFAASDNIYYQMKFPTSDKTSAKILSTFKP